MDSVNRNLLYIKIECTVGKQGKKKKKVGDVNEDTAVLPQ